MIRLTTVCWLVVVILCSTATAFGQLLLQETFNTPVSDISLSPSPAWTTLSAGTIGSTVAPPYIVVNPGSALSYPGYIESGNGNSAYLAGGGQDAQVNTGTVTPTVDGTIFLAFMMKVDAASSAGDYVWIARNTSNHNRWRMWIKSTNAGANYELAVSKSSTNPSTYTSKNLVFGTTYLVVAKYDFKGASTTDAALKLWVNPALSSFGTAEDASPAINFTEAANDFTTNMNRFALVMNDAAAAPTWHIGGIRMATDWKTVLPSPPLYYKGTGDITDPNNWGPNTDGSGTPPSDFGANGQLYLVANTTSVNLTTPWVVGGTGSKVIVGNGVNFTFGSGGILTAPIDVATGGTIILASSDWPIFGNVAGNVTIGAGITLSQDQILPVSTGYYVMSGDLNVGSFKLTVKGRLRTAGYKITGSNFQLDSAGTLGIYSAAGITTSGATGDIQTTTRTFSPYGTYAYMGSVDQVTGNALPDSVSNFTLQMGSRTNVVTLTKALRVLSNLTMTLGKAKLGNINLWFSNPVGGTDSSYIITDGTGALVRPITNTGVKTMCIGSATDFRRTVLTFESTPTATNISFRFIAGDPGSAGYPVGIVKHDVAGSWMLTYDVNPLSTYKLDITLPALADVMRLMSRANPSTAWAAEGTLSTYTAGVLSTPNIGTFGQEFAVGGSATLAVGDESNGSLPKSVSLKQNYPNPFNPATTIVYELPRESRVTIAVYDVVGQEVATLVNGTMQAGVHQVAFDASRLASGVYLYQLRTDGIVRTQKMLLLK